MMGKSWKYSQGHSSGFVPDYRHAVETMGESEGMGSLVRGGLEDSYASKRKCVNPDLDYNNSGYNGLSVPMQVLSLSCMSRSEKKDLELKLKHELEQVRRLQKKLAEAAIPIAPPAPLLEKNINKPAVISTAPPPPEKKRAAPHPPVKRSLSGKFQSGKPARAPPPASASSNAMVMKQCENLLARLMSHQFSWVFNTPVDIVKLNIPDYFTVIKNPMDLGTIKKKIVSCEYASPLDFAADVRLTFSNAMTYNPVTNDVHVMADSLRKYFEVRWKPIAKKLQVANDIQSVKPEVISTPTPTPPLKKKKTVQTEASIVFPQKPEPVKQVIITPEEKQKLGLELEELLGESPVKIIEFLKLHSQAQVTEEEIEIEIDIDSLGDDTLVTLRKLVDEYLLEKQKNRSKSEPCEIELHNESGLSNCSVQPCKGNELPDEDVDVDIVGGNNPPVSSFPPVEIEKDAANKNSKHGSPSSSSSDSGSSSSDSDSGSSSDSESDSPKSRVPSNALKSQENLNSSASPDHEMGNPPGNSEAVNLGDSGLVKLVDSQIGNLGDSDTANHGDSDMGDHPYLAEEAPPAEQNPESKPIRSNEGDDRQDGESAPSERPVSPEKQYRQAYLKNRFLDTILKAREKALEKVEKRDPEKLQKEKEELERRKKEEKARLQAEALAAEEARRKAEQEAAAEAKRKREREREAARQALQMMEKTVDINENSQFMEDLEMLRTAADDEELPNFEEEASPELSQNALGSFKLQGNALEQLGLYMKMDEDFEEEEPESPQKNPEKSIDVEEGEID